MMEVVVILIRYVCINVNNYVVLSCIFVVIIHICIQVAVDIHIVGNYGNLEKVTVMERSECHGPFLVHPFVGGV